jgi:hypothetical protein
MTPDEKRKANEDLRQALQRLEHDTFRYWLILFRADETLRKHSGYSKGADDMLVKLVKAYEQKFNKLMAPSDRGDYD